MPTYSFETPDGKTISLEGDSPPTEEELNQIYYGGNAPKQSGVTDQNIKQVSENFSPAPERMAYPGSSAQNMQTPQQAEAALNEFESKNRHGIGTFLYNAAGNVGTEVGSLAKGIKNLITHPYESGKAIRDSIQKMSPEDASTFAKHIVADMGKTIGIDTSRPNSNWDIDVALRKWEGKPLSAIADATVLLSAAEKVGAAGLSLAAKAGLKSEVFSALRRSGSEIANMAEAIKSDVPVSASDMENPVLNQLDKNKTKTWDSQYANSQRAAENVKRYAQGINAPNMISAIPEGMKSAQETSAKTPFEKLVEHAPVIKGRGTGAPGFTIKQLDDPQVAMDISSSVAKDLNSMMLSERSKMNSALEPYLDRKLSTREIYDKIQSSINGETGANTNMLDIVDDASKIGEIGKAEKDKLDRFLKMVKPGSMKENYPFADTPHEVSVRDIKSAIDVLDESINYETAKTSQSGLKAMRRVLRKELTNVSKEYDAAATKIHDRLIEIGSAEGNLIKANKDGLSRDYLEKMGLDIVKSRKKLQAFTEAMNIVGTPEAGKALGKIQSLDAWRAWNDFFKTNTHIFDQGVQSVVGRGIFGHILPESAIQSVMKRGTMMSLGEGAKAAEAAIKATPGAIGRGTSKLFKGASKASSITDKLFNQDN